MPAGRPTTYTPELGNKICRAISTSTESIQRISEANPEFPCRQTIWEWRWDFEDFGDMYAKAKERQAEILADELIDIADDGRNDWMQRIDAPGYQVNGDAIARSRLRVDTRKWVACKLLPKVYGDKSENKNEGTVHIVVHEDTLKGLK